MSQKKKFFTQIDFSATPYIEKSPGKAGSKKYFPHIITDFTIQEAIKKWLVKSLTLDERKELASLSDDDLDFNAERDDDRSVIGLSNGQKIMIQAGLTKLKILEEQFTSLSLNSTKYPKMLIVCEDTNVVPYVEWFLLEQGYSDEEYQSIHSNKKWEVNKEERDVSIQNFSWCSQNPKVIVFWCLRMIWCYFYVPLRSAASSVLLEQTIGRGLRLMRREHEDMRMENSNYSNKKSTRKLLDFHYLEHPRFKILKIDEEGQCLKIVVMKKKKVSVIDLIFDYVLSNADLFIQVIRCRKFKSPIHWITKELIFGKIK